MSSSLKAAMEYTQRSFGSSLSIEFKDLAIRKCSCSVIKHLSFPNIVTRSVKNSPLCRFNPVELMIRIKHHL